MFLTKDNYLKRGQDCTQTKKVQCVISVFVLGGNAAYQEPHR